jgi:hypothetical protein
LEKIGYVAKVGICHLYIYAAVLGFGAFVSLSAEAAGDTLDSLDIMREQVILHGMSTALGESLIVSGRAVYICAAIDGYGALALIAQ